MFFWTTGEVSKKLVFLTWAKIDAESGHNVASWPPKARFLVDFHPPHPAGVASVLD